MRNLTIGDLKLALRDLLDERAGELRLSATGKLYERRLRAKQKEIDAIPDAAGTQAPLARELSEADVRHDGLGAAIFFFCKAIEAHPALPAALKEAAATAQQTFVPKLEVLRAPYADEASAALDNRPDQLRRARHAHEHVRLADLGRVAWLDARLFLLAVRPDLVDLHRPAVDVAHQPVVEPLASLADRAAAATGSPACSPP